MKRMLTLSLLLLAAPVFSQTMPAGVNPDLIDEFSKLPVAQQQALARQYGIEIPGSSGVMSSTDPTGQLSLPGEPLPQSEPDSNVVSDPLFLLESDLDIEEEVDVPRYGQNLFDQTVSTFAPTDDAMVEESYRLGVGDELRIQLFGKDNEEMVLQIGRDGDITLPRLGPLTLVGLTFQNARELVKSRIQSELVGVSAVITMGRLRAINIFMAGEVGVPGAYSMSSLSTVTQALFQAGGVTEIGSLRDIQVLRGGELIGSFDLYDLLMRGDSTGDIRLRTGDVVFVPPYSGLVEVLGEVKRPAAYEIRDGDSIGDALMMAGSFTSQAYPITGTLRRLESNVNVAKTVDLTNDAVIQSTLRDGDRLTVPATPTITAQSISLEGAVQRPAIYGWTPGMHVSDVIRNVRVDLNSDADLSYAIVVSEMNAARDIRVHPFSILEALEKPGSAADPELQEFDRILVMSLPTLGLVPGPFSRDTLLAPILDQLRVQANDEQSVRVFSISGAVRSPGVYPLIDGLTAADMITAAGGLKDSAYMEAAELRSITVADGNRVKTSTQTLNLNNVLNGGSVVTVSSRDNLLVRELDEWSPSASVQLSGEVVFPGTYLISRDETLSEVIDRAGGLTSDAFLEGAQFTRASIARREEQQAQEFAENIRKSFATMMLTEETSNTSYSEIKDITEVLDTYTGTGRLLIDLWAVVREPGVDIELEDGDALLVPKRNATVTVVGEVNRSSTHSYQKGLDVDDYLRLSAGLTSRADKGGIYIVRANGQVSAIEKDWWRFDEERRRISAGDTIVVPVNVEHKESLARWREITQVVYQSIVSIAAIARL